jgi:hypothetical protein
VTFLGILDCIIPSRNTVRVILGITYDIRDVESVDDEVSPNQTMSKSKLKWYMYTACHNWGYISCPYRVCANPGLALDVYLPNQLRAAIPLIPLGTYGSVQHTVRSIPRWVPWLGSEIKLLAAWGEEDRVAISKPFNYVKNQKVNLDPISFVRSIVLTKSA